MKYELHCGNTFDESEAVRTECELMYKLKFPCGCEIDVSNFETSIDMSTETVHVVKADNETLCGLISGMLVPFTPTETFQLCETCQSILDKKMS